MNERLLQYRRSNVTYRFPRLLENVLYKLNVCRPAASAVYNRFGLMAKIWIIYVLYSDECYIAAHNNI